MQQWKGKVAIVTGASSGIGNAIAETLVKNGLKVVGLARRIERLHELKNKLSKASGEFHPLKCDMTVEKDIKNAFEWVKNNLGGLSILVNNAGVTVVGSFDSSNTDGLKKILDTNILGLAIASREALKLLKKRDEPGYIININSVTGHYIPNMSASMYVASKHAVTALTETIRLELAGDKTNKIKITSVSPGLVLTEILGSTETFKEAAKKENIDPLVAQDIADAVVYILSTPLKVHVTELTIRPLNEIL